LKKLTSGLRPEAGHYSPERIILMTASPMMVQEVPLDKIYPDEQFNSRGPIAPIDVVDLAKSIEEEGLIQPVVVTPLDDKDARRKEGAMYLLVAGYRRYHAHRILKRITIQAIVREKMDEVKCRILNLKENLDRKDLNILQEAKAISRLKELGVGEVNAAECLNKSRGWVQVRYMLLELPDEIQQEAAAGIIRQSDIRIIYSMPDRETRLVAAKKIKESVARGETKVEAQIKAQGKKKSDKKIRKKVEIQQMMEHMQETIGNGVWTRALAWACGEVADYDLFASMKEYADKEGLDYNIPKDGEY
jgi:ParB family chromosome partitioning protein